MIINSGYFNAKIQSDGIPDRVYDATDLINYLDGLVGNGIFPNPSSNFQVFPLTNMDILIKQGKAWINGYKGYTLEDKTLTLNSADVSFNRIDRIVLRLNLDERVIEIDVKQGANATNPTPQPIQRNSIIYELVLADIFIPAGATTTTTANITDQRQNKELCGYVEGLIKEIDTETLLNQIRGDLSAQGEEILNSVKAWLQSIHDVIDGETATNLLNLINNNKADTDNEINDINTNLNNLTQRVQSNNSLINNVNTDLINRISSTNTNINNINTNLSNRINNNYNSLNNSISSVSSRVSTNSSNISTLQNQNTVSVGNWNPKLYMGGYQCPYYATPSGRYSRHGNLVWVRFHIRPYVAKNSSYFNTQMDLEGLPYAGVSVGGGQGISLIMMSSIHTQYSPSIANVGARLGGSYFYLFFNETNGSGGFANVTVRGIFHGDIHNDAQLELSGSFTYSIN